MTTDPKLLNLITKITNDLEERIDKVQKDLWAHKHQIGPKVEDRTSIPFIVVDRREETKE